MSESALYECKRQCHIPVCIDANGTVVNKMFYPQDADGQRPESDYKYQVPKGELVPHHFNPVNDVAKSDREDQVTNPEDYIETPYDLGVIAELMVERGFYDDKTFYDEKRGQYIVSKSAKRVAMESIRETIGEDVYRALLNGEQNASQYRTKEDAVAKLKKLGADDTETRKALVKILTDAGITKGYFRGAPVEKLAAFVYDKGLYKD